MPLWTESASTRLFVQLPKACTARESTEERIFSRLCILRFSCYLYRETKIEEHWRWKKNRLSIFNVCKQTNVELRVEETIVIDDVVSYDVRWNVVSLGLQTKIWVLIFNFDLNFFMSLQSKFNLSSYRNFLHFLQFIYFLHLTTFFICQPNAPTHSHILISREQNFHFQQKSNRKLWKRAV